jgi:hypothetical protein
MTERLSAMAGERVFMDAPLDPSRQCTGGADRALGVHTLKMPAGGL